MLHVLLCVMWIDCTCCVCDAVWVWAQGEEWLCVCRRPGAVHTLQRWWVGIQSYTTDTKFAVFHILRVYCLLNHAPPPHTQFNMIEWSSCVLGLQREWRCTLGPRNHTQSSWASRWESAHTGNVAMRLRLSSSCGHIPASHEYAWKNNLYKVPVVKKSFSLQSFHDLPQKPVLVDMVCETNNRTKVLYASSVG